MNNNSNNAVMNIVNNIVNNEGLLTTLNHLHGRWLDECKYEDFKDYEKVMSNSLSKMNNKNISFLCGTKRPFGFKCKINNSNIHVFLKTKGRYVILSAKPC